MTQFTNNGNSYLVVDVPEDAVYPVVSGGNLLTYILASGGADRIQLPLGHRYSILGTVTKDWVFGFDVKRLGLESTMEKGSFYNAELGHHQSGGWTKFYRNYLYPNPSICIPNTAQQSARSLLESNGVVMEDGVNKLILKLNQKQ
jgi:hypothetical protein